MAGPFSVQETFAARLRLLRKAHGYTQVQVAQMVNVERTTYNKYENGKSMPPLETVLELARVLGDNDPRFLLQISVADDTCRLSDGVGALSTEEMEIVLRFRALSEEEQQSMIRKLREEAAARLLQNAAEEQAEED